jgi:hypothetical protein
VLVQNTISDVNVATKCFGKKPPNLNATFPSNEWYDRECKELKTRYIGLVRSGAGMEERMAARKAYCTLVRSKNLQHKLSKLKSCVDWTLQASGYWGPRKPLRLRDISTWYSHNSKLLSAGVTLPGNASETIDSTAGMKVSNSNRLFDPHGAATLNEPFSGQEVEQARTKMKNNKAAGKDGVKPEFF